MYEDVVHALDHAMTVHPNVLPVTVGPVSLDPDPFRTEHGGLRDGDGRWRWGRRRVCGRDRVGLLDDNHGFTADILGNALLDLDNDVVRRAR